MYQQKTLICLMGNAVQEKGHQYQSRSTHPDQDWKHLDILGRKSYLSTTLQFQISNYEALMANKTVLHRSHPETLTMENPG